MHNEADNNEAIVPSVPHPPAAEPIPELDLTRVRLAAEKVKDELGKIVIGQENFMDMLLAALFCGGHVLVEGVPGIAKTLTTKMMAQSLDLRFSRIQFTPDLMPSDVLGTTVFNVKTSEFSFNSGPIFANVVLIDEINRSPAKTQAALFEVMEEHQVTVDGQTYTMGFPFFVIATQNPIEQEGTYKLPEAQLDRFLMKVNINYPNLEDEKAILRRFRNDFSLDKQHEVGKVLNAEEIRECQALIEQVFIREELLDYIASIVHNTRDNGDLFLGASPRASLALMKTSKAVAAMNGRAFVTPDDIRQVAFSVLNHRIILMPEREMEGYTAADVIEDILQKIEVPR